MLGAITPKIKPYLDINLTKCTQDLYHENYKMLMKEFKKIEIMRVASSIIRLEDSA